MKSHIFLFESVKAAQEVAYALRGNWDSCNGVELMACDNSALKFAVALCNAEYCEVGNACNILDDIRESKSVLMIGFSDLKGLQGGLKCRQDKLFGPETSLIILPLIASQSH